MPQIVWIKDRQIAKETLPISTLDSFWLNTVSLPWTKSWMDF